MIYEITTELRAELAAKKVPFEVVYGPERRAATSLSRTRIVIERDRQGGDQLGPRRSGHKNPRMRAVRAVGCVCRIFAQSTESGASDHDHERLADQLLDKVHVALDKIVLARRTLWRPSSAKLLTREELGMAALEQWPGAVYELRFSVDRGVFDTDFEGVGLPVGSIDAIKSTTKVVGEAGEEVACGGP